MYQKLNWGSREAQDATTFLSRWYQCKMGYRDVIQILDDLYQLPIHTWNPKSGKPSFASALCSKPTSGKCPVCERQESLINHQNGEQFGTVLIHYAKQPLTSDKALFVGKVLAWKFGNDKKGALLDIYHNQGGLDKTELNVKLVEQTERDMKYQKLSILPSGRSLKETLQKNEKFAAQIEDELKKLSEVQRELHPTYDDTVANWKGALGIDTDFDPSQYEGTLEKDVITIETEEAESKYEGSGPIIGSGSEKEGGDEDSDEVLSGLMVD